MIKFIIIFIVILLLTIGCYYYIKNLGHTVLYDNPDLFYGNKELYIGQENMPNSNEKVKYSFSIWLRTNNISENSIWYNNPNEPKTIVFNNGSPNIQYLRKNNTIRIQIVYNNSENILEMYNFDLEEIPSQVWCNIVVTVNNEYVDIYKNGILYKSKQLPNPNLKSYKMMNIGEKYNNFNGYIGRIDYYNYVLTSEKILELYNYKDKLPNNLMSYESYEYLRKEKEKINN